MSREEREHLLHQRMLRLMAKHSLCMAEVGREIGYHGRSINYHLDKIQAETGIDPRTFYGLCELLGYRKEE